VNTFIQSLTNCYVIRVYERGNEKFRLGTDTKQKEQTDLMHSGCLNHIIASLV